jgi:hypothetical protein
MLVRSRRAVPGNRVLLFHHPNISGKLFSTILPFLRRLIMVQNGAMRLWK